MSLTEVLVALFILTLGVIGILTMFPLGAAQMALAVRDDRSAQAAVIADGYMRTYWRTQIVEQSGGTDPFFQAFTNPSVINSSLPSIQATATQPSYPVVIDPMGNLITSRTGIFGDQSSPTLIPRTSLNGITSQTSLFAYRTCSLVDNLGYNDNGTPTGDSEMRYNWLWVLQRPLNQSAPSPGAYTANMTVVVFDRRPFLYPPATTPFEVVIPNASFTTGYTTVTINLSAGQQAPDLRQGSWVMDATILNPTGQLPIRQANFYRVVSMAQNPSNPAQMLVELQTPIVAPVGYSSSGYTYTGTLVSIRGVSGVFVRPPLTPN